MDNHFSAEEVRESIAAIKANIAAAAKRAGRNPEDITLMAVTKTVDPQLVNVAYEEGVTLFGENKAQELVSKYDDYAFKKEKIHFIGTLQSNKVKQIIDKVSMIESVNSVKLAKEISKQAKKHDIVMPILLEVNIGREEGKSGIMPEDLEATLVEVSKIENILVSGLMSIPPICENNAEITKYFTQLHEMFIDIKAKKLDNINMQFLSMGMTSDYEAAVECGSNIVRVGSGMFGKRNYAVQEGAL